MKLIVNMKTCKKCSFDKETMDFNKSLANKDGLDIFCRICRQQNRHKYDIQYRNKNKDTTIKSSNFNWANQNKLKIKDRMSKYFQNHKEEYKARSEKLKQKNPNYSANYMRNKRHNDMNFKIIGNLRSRLNMAIKNNWKNGSAISDLGCSIDELKIHLERQFKTGMTWENYGKFGWHIDHILPLSKFDLSDREQLLKICNYRNLQPMWCQENLSKGAKLADELVT